MYVSVRERTSTTRDKYSLIFPPGNPVVYAGTKESFTGRMFGDVYGLEAIGRLLAEPEGKGVSCEVLCRRGV